MSDGPWEMSGPEEGDKVDQSVFICHADFDGYEVIEITFGTAAMKKAAARKIVDILNRNEARMAGA